ncbi:MAG: DUF6531 domain-containing protein, partial [Thermodesulfobacteriota bacterium]
MNRHKKIAYILLTVLVHLFSFGSAWATSASINVSGNEGAITVSASATFMQDTHCDNQGNCWAVNSGSLAVYQDNNGYLGGQGGNGSATFSTIVDGGGLSQGSHTFTAIARDHEGGSASDSRTIVIDNTPTATVNSPGLVSGAFDITGSVTFKERINGPEGYVYVYIDNGFYGSKTFEGTSHNWKFSDFPNGYFLDAGGFSQGTHTIRIVARAANGAMHEVQTTFTIDNTPTATVNSPGLVSGAFDITGSVTFKERINGPEGYVYVYIDNGFYGSKTFEGTSHNWKFSDFPNGYFLDAGGFSQGTHTIRIVARAANGAMHEVQTTFTIDNTPTATVNSPGLVSGAFDITGTVTFKERVNAAEGSISIYIDNGYRGGKTFEGTSINWKASDFIGMLNASNFSLGVHNIRVVARAANGATSTAEGTFEVSKCDIKINNFSGTSGTINANGGETVTLSANIIDSSGKGIKWTMNVAGKSYSGTGKSVSERWDGKDSSGRLLPSGSYTATLHAETDDGKCSADASLPIRVENDNGCSLKVIFGSTANIATGNLAHEQELFTTSGTGLNTAITLYYNSLDSHNGSLGRSWSHTYDITAKTDVDGSVLI